MIGPLKNTILFRHDRDREWFLVRMVKGSVLGPIFGWYFLAGTVLSNCYVSNHILTICSWLRYTAYVSSIDCLELIWFWQMFTLPFIFPLAYHFSIRTARRAREYLALFCYKFLFYRFSIFALRFSASLFAPTLLFTPCTWTVINAVCLHNTN